MASGNSPPLLAGSLSRLLSVYQASHCRLPLVFLPHLSTLPLLSLSSSTLFLFLLNWDCFVPHRFLSIKIMSLSMGVEVRVFYELDSEAHSTTVVCPPNCVVSFLRACIGDALLHRLPPGLKVQRVVHRGTGETLGEAAVVGRALAADPSVLVVFGHEQPEAQACTLPATTRPQAVPERPPRKRNRRVSSAPCGSAITVRPTVDLPAGPQVLPARAAPFPTPSPSPPSGPSEDDPRTSSRQRVAPKHLRQDFHLGWTAPRTRKRALSLDVSVDAPDTTASVPMNAERTEETETRAQVEDKTELMDSVGGQTDALGHNDEEEDEEGEEEEGEEEEEEDMCEEDGEEGLGEPGAKRPEWSGKVSIDDAEERLLRRQLSIQLAALRKMSSDLRGLGHGERKRLRNRQASRVSRLKKKLYVFDLQRRYNDEMDQRVARTRDIESLRGDVRQLLSVIQQRDPAFIFTPSA